MVFNDVLRTSRLLLLESLEVTRASEDDDDDDDLEHAISVFWKDAPRLSAVTYSSLSFRTFIPPLSVISPTLTGGCTKIGLTHEQFRNVVISSPHLNKLSLHQAVVRFKDGHAPIEIPTLLSFE
jgi:hypothetical protein